MKITQSRLGGRGWLALFISAGAGGLQLLLGASPWLLLILGAVVLAWAMAAIRSDRSWPRSRDDLNVDFGVDVGVDFGAEREAQRPTHLAVVNAEAEPLHFALASTSSGAMSVDARTLTPKSSDAAKVSEATVSLFASATNAVHEVMGELRSDLGQMQREMSDAVATLDASFGGLETNAREQSKLVLRLAQATAPQNREDDAASSETLQELVASMDDTMREFVDVVLSVARTSTAGATRIEQISLDMGRLDHLCIGARKLADRSRSLALNATVGAAHLGSSGDRFCLVSDEIKPLSLYTQEFNREIEVIVKSVRNTIEASDDDIGDFASKGTDCSVESKAKVDQMLWRIDQAYDELAQTVSGLCVLNEQLSADVGDAIRSLQFTDILHRTSERSEACVNRVEEFLGEIATRIERLESESEAIDDLQAVVDEFAGAAGQEALNMADQHATVATAT